MRREPSPARLAVVRPGWLTTVQDLGRFGFQRFGMPPAGAMDPFALRCANRLVGNPDQAAALEITVQGPEIRFEEEAVIAFTGADLTPTMNGALLPAWTTVMAGKGSRLTFGARRSGARSYLAVAGGFDLPIVLGSRSTHLRSHTGGFAGRALVKGDTLHGGKPNPGVWRLVGRSLPDAARPGYSPTPILRTVPGPQADWFTPDTVNNFLGGRYRVSSQSDRMGYRLLGPELDRAGREDMVSEAVPLGALQVPADRQPILLSADRQTTGGYPKIAVVISADIPLAAQLLPGDSVRFALIEVPEAQALFRAQRAALDAALPPIG
ncbi:MAG: biotin-dependent carboxyltransferase family protein [Nitrospirota bacterium]